MGLTPKQYDALLFIRRFLEAKGYAPSFEDLMGGLEITSKSNIHRILQCLEERGHIRRLKGQARAIEVVSATHDTETFRLAMHLPRSERRRLIAMLAGLEASDDGDGGWKAAVMLKRIIDRLTCQPRKAAA